MTDIVMLNGPTGDMPHADVHLGAFAIPTAGETGDRTISFQTRISANRTCWARLHTQWYERGEDDTLNPGSTDPLTPVLRLGTKGVVVQRTGTSAANVFKLVFLLPGGEQWEMPDPNGEGVGALHSLPGFIEDPADVGVIFTDVTTGESWTYPDPSHIRRNQTNVTEYTWNFDDGGGDGDFNDLVVAMHEGDSSPTVLNILQTVEDESATHWRPYFEFWSEDPRVTPDTSLTAGTYVQMEGLYLPDNGLSLGSQEYLDGDQPYGIWEGVPRRSSSIYGAKPPPDAVVLGDGLVIPTEGTPPPPPPPPPPTPFEIDPLMAVTPILGNENHGGAVQDPSSGQTLYAVLHEGEIQIWRTRTTGESFVLEDYSVDYLATIDSHSASWINPTTVALQYIDGVLYASVNGKRPASGAAGHWIFKDTSTEQNGTGPWTLHGTVQSLSIDMTDGAGHFAGGYGGGEIRVIDGGLWVTNTATYGIRAGENQTWAKNGVATSEDGGLTWTNRLTAEFYVSGGIYGYWWSRNTAKFEGLLYVGGIGAVTPGKHYTSPDAIDWTSIGDLGADDEVGYAFPFTADGRIYRLSPLVPSGSDWKLHSADAAPDTMPEWRLDLDTSAFGLPSSNQTSPLVCDIGTPSSRRWAMVFKGKALGFATGPVE